MLTVHFLNVGHGDCCIIEFKDSGRTAMVDINRSSEFDDETTKEILSESTNLTSADLVFLKYGVLSKSEILERYAYDIQLTDPIEYLKDKNITSIFRFISTHPHMDHLTGLNAAKLYFSNLWICNNDFDQDSLSESQKVDWDLYVKYKNVIGNYLDGVKVLDVRKGSQGDFYTQDGIYILAPTDDLLKLADEKDNRNIMSTVLLIKHGNCKIVLGGDAESDTWEYIKDNFEEDIKDITILKASHHGRDSGYHQEAVKLMSPQYTIVSVGKKPGTDASNKYRRYSDYVYSTRWKGNISFDCYLDGTVSLNCEYDR